MKNNYFRITKLLTNLDNLNIIMPLQDFLFYFKLGWSHIVSFDALDHQLFILALVAVYTSKNLKQVLILITAFTSYHEVTNQFG